MSDRPWSDVRDEFTRVVFREGIDEIARRLPAHRATVYRLINGSIQRPSGVMRAAVERIVADATAPSGSVSDEQTRREG